MSEHEILMWVIPALGTILSLTGLGMMKQLSSLANSSRSLAIDIAVIAEKVNSHDGRIKNLEEKSH